MLRRDWWLFRGLSLSPDDGAAGGSSGGDSATAAAESSADAVASSSSSSQAAQPPADPAKLRELVLKANVDVIPEMIAGDTLDALLASVEPARAAYQRIVQSVTGTAGGVASAPRIPAGGGQRQFVVNIEELSPSAKIAEGLRQRKARSSGS